MRTSTRTLAVIAGALRPRTWPRPSPSPLTRVWRSPWINRALHVMAVVQLRHRGTDGRRYYDRRVAEGKTPIEAMRALKRRLSDVVYHQLVADQKRQRQQEPAAARQDTRAFLRDPARPARTPTPALRTSHFPGPPTVTLRPLR